MNIPIVDNCSFNGLRYSVQPGVIPTKEQRELKQLVEDKFNDPFSDYDIIKDLENIAGADVFITVGQDKGHDVVFLDVRKKNIDSEPLSKLEISFYDSPYSQSNETLIAEKGQRKINKNKINNLYNNCKYFVREMLVNN